MRGNEYRGRRRVATGDRPRHRTRRRRGVVLLCRGRDLGGTGAASAASARASLQGDLGFVEVSAGRWAPRSRSGGRRPRFAGPARSTASRSTARSSPTWSRRSQSSPRSPRARRGSPGSATSAPMSPTASPRSSSELASLRRRRRGARGRSRRPARRRRTARWSRPTGITAWRWPSR